MLAENFGGIIAPHSHEMYTAGKQVAADLGVPLVFGLLGTGHEDALSNIGTLPDSVEIRTRDLEEDEEYPYEAWADAAAEMIREVKPHIVIGSGSSFGLDYVPRAAARLGMPLATWVTSVAVDDGGLVVTRDVLGGRAETAIRCEPGTPFMFALEPGMVDPSRIGDVEPITLQEVFAELAPDSGAATRANVRKLTASERIVSGGRGMRGPEGIALVEELADVLEAAVGASGAAVLQGMLPHEYQVGSSGEVVRPKLYLAVGLSGTPQHTFGMRESQFIVAINSDPNAPIFQLADFGIVGDLFTVVPALIAALKNPA
jgi:electron transfer flavoprotein alpha subunit